MIEILIACQCALMVGLASWCVAFGPKNDGSEETPPTCRIAAPQRGNARALATEQKRNVQLDLSMTRL